MPKDFLVGSLFVLLYFTQMNNEKAKQILDSNRYATIATVDGNGLPWAAPVWYVVDEYKNIYWWSPVASRHSLNIKNNSQCYITIFDSTLPEGEGIGLYMRSIATELDNVDEINEVIGLYNSTTNIFNLELDNCFGEAPTRLYRAVPSSIWINGDSEINGQYVDIRKELS